MWNQITSPLRGLTGLPSLERLAVYSDTIILQHRLFFSNLFAVAESISYILDNDIFAPQEKDWLFYQELERLLPQPYTDAQALLLKDLFHLGEDNTYSFTLTEQMQKAEDSPSFEAVFQKFLLLFDHGNIVWIDYLLLAEQMNPNHPETLQYLLHYAEALEDEELIKHCTEKLLALSNTV